MDGCALALRQGGGGVVEAVCHQSPAAPLGDVQAVDELRGAAGIAEHGAPPDPGHEDAAQARKLHERDPVALGKPDQHGRGGPAVRFRLGGKGQDRLMRQPERRGEQHVIAVQKLL
ncbi:MAG: hypothetical protein ACK5QX_04765 [bacterium]